MRKISKKECKKMLSMLDYAMKDIGKIIRASRSFSGSCSQEELFWIGVNRGLMEIEDYLRYYSTVPCFLERRRQTIQSSKYGIDKNHFEGYLRGFDFGLKMLETGILTIPKPKTIKETYGFN